MWGKQKRTIYGSVEFICFRPTTTGSAMTEASSLILFIASLSSSLEKDLQKTKANGSFIGFVLVSKKYSALHRLLGEPHHWISNAATQPVLILFIEVFQARLKKTCKKQKHLPLFCCPREPQAAKKSILVICYLNVLFKFAKLRNTNLPIYQFTNLPFAIFPYLHHPK
jgi:hypothetical protein